MSASVLQSRRLAAVQTPVIPIISRWTAETPGTISLGQGIVAYGPPPEAIEAARRFGASLDDHRYGPVEGQLAANSGHNSLCVADARSGTDWTRM